MKLKCMQTHIEKYISMSIKGHEYNDICISMKRIFVPSYRQICVWFCKFPLKTSSKKSRLMHANSRKSSAQSIPETLATLNISLKADDHHCK